jgi:hypothetical protein
LWWQYINFLFHLSFWMWVYQIVVVGDQGINWMPNLLKFSPSLNSFQQFISFVICFLILWIITKFKEWNLARALYYIDFNLITPFHFQYYASDPIIYCYNNLLVSFFMCVKSTSFSVQFHIHPTSFSKHIIEFILIGIPIRCPSCSLSFGVFKFMPYVW